MHRRRVAAILMALALGFPAFASSGQALHRGVATDQVPARPAPPVAASAAGGATLEFEVVPSSSSPVQRVRVQRRRLVKPLPLADTTPEVQAAIVNGGPITIDQAPWQVRVNYGCGGTLIQRTWVMTAAHCVEGDRASDIAVWAGVGNRSEMRDQNGLLVRSVHVHPKFDRDTFAYDIALLQLTSSASGTPVRLYTDRHGPSTGSTGFISGWGYLAYETPPMPDQLQGASVTVADDQSGTCGDYPGGYVDNEVMFCAGSADGSVDACQGDSGGPLAIVEDDHWYVAGITSWGFDCATAGYPGVYTRVGRLVPWIHRTIGWRDVDTLDCSESPCTSALVEDLETGVGYVFRVRGRNDAGWSDWSRPSVAATAG